MDIDFGQIFAVLQFIQSIYPLSFMDSLTLGLVLKEMFTLAVKHEWNKLAKVAEEKAMPLFNSAFENEERRDKVLLALYSAAPSWFKKVVSFSQIDFFFDNYYNSKIKPMAKEKGIHDSIKKEEQETPQAQHWF